MRSTWLLVVLFAIIGVASGAVFSRQRRQTYKYDDELMAYAHPHPGTKVSQGYLARYGPQDWPKWYSRNMMSWDGMYRMSPGNGRPMKYGVGK